MSSPAMPKNFKILSSSEQFRTVKGPARKQYLKDLFTVAYSRLKDGSWKGKIGSPAQFHEIVSYCMQNERTLTFIFKRVPEEFAKGIEAARASLESAPVDEGEIQKKVDELASLDKAEKEAAEAARKAQLEKEREEKKIQRQIMLDQDRINSKLVSINQALGGHQGAIYAALHGDGILLILDGAVRQPMGGSLGQKVSAKSDPWYLLQNMSGTFRAGPKQVSYEDAIGATTTGLAALAYEEKKKVRSGTYISLDINQPSAPHPLLQMPGKTPVRFYGTAVVVTGMGNLELSNGRELRRGLYPGDGAKLTVDFRQIPDIVAIAGSGLRVGSSTVMHLDDRNHFTQTSPHIESDPDWYASVLADRLASRMINGHEWTSRAKPYFYLRFQPPGLQMRLHVSVSASRIDVVDTLSQAIRAGRQCSGDLNTLLNNPGLHVTGEASYGDQNLGIYPAGRTVTGLDGKIRRYVVRDEPTWTAYLRLTVNSDPDTVDQAAPGSPIWRRLNDWANTLIAEAQQTITAAALTGMLAP